MSVHTSMVVRPGEGASIRIEAFGQTVDDPYGDGGDKRILAVRIDGPSLSIQGDPADVLALVDRIRDAMIAEVGRRWPVEKASHAPAVSV